MTSFSLAELRSWRAMSIRATGNFHMGVRGGCRSGRINDLRCVHSHTVRHHALQ